MRLRWLTQAELETLHGRPVPAPIAHAIGLESGDRLLGTGGLYRRGDHLVLFSDMGAEVLKRPRWILRGVRELLARAAGETVIAKEEAGNPRAGALLKHLGFKPVHNGDFRGRVYQWHCQ